MDTYDLLIKKLDAFIRKYYHNLLVRGAIYSGALIGSTFLGNVAGAMAGCCR